MPSASSTSGSASRSQGFSGACHSARQSPMGLRRSSCSASWPTACVPGWTAILDGSARPARHGRSYSCGYQLRQQLAALIACGKASANSCRARHQPVGFAGKRVPEPRCGGYRSRPGCARHMVLRPSSWPSLSRRARDSTTWRCGGGEDGLGSPGDRPRRQAGDPVRSLGMMWSAKSAGSRRSPRGQREELRPTSPRRTAAATPASALAGIQAMETQGSRPSSCLIGFPEWSRSKRTDPPEAPCARSPSARGR